MEPPASRKRGREVISTQKTPVCVVHIPGIKHGKLQMLSKTGDLKNKLQKLNEIKRRRLAEPHGSAHRLEDACRSIPEELSEEHGYHRECYQRFTMNLNRLSSPLDTHSQPTSETPETSRRSTSDKIIFNPDCIFCKSENRRKVKKKGAWTTEGLSNFERDGWIKVLSAAESKSDESLLVRIRGQDLFACEAKYHKGCLTTYLQDPEKWRSGNSQEKANQLSMEKSHSTALTSITDTIKADVLEKRGFLKLSDLLATYIENLRITDHPNPDYRASRLKEKILKSEVCDSRVSFCRLGDFQTTLIYSSEIDLDTAVRHAYKLGSTDMIATVGKQIHQSIKEAFNETGDPKWPPTAQDLVAMRVDIPTELSKLLTYIITGHESTMSSRCLRLVDSISQDLCRAATNSEWKLPKHVLLCMSLRHLFRSEKLTTLMNRLGHCESYSFSLQLESALAEAVELNKSYLTSQIVKTTEGSTIFHSEFDNFDQFVNTGRGSVHTAHGIMLQEVADDKPAELVAQLPSLPKSKRRSLHSTEDTPLPECYVTKRQSPKLTITQLLLPGSKEAGDVSTLKLVLWSLLRYLCKGDQEVPGWNGFISQSGQKPHTLTTIDYYPVISKPITEYTTVQECLRYAEHATGEVGQIYSITTFDLGVCMKALPLIWNNPKRYEKHIVLIGTFHLVCAYLRMIGKKMDGSGISDIFLESGLIGSGSLNGVMGGKHYERALHCHKTLLEALERLLYQQLMESEEQREFLSGLSDESKEHVRNLVQSPSPEALDAVLSDPGVLAYLQNYLHLKEGVRNGLFGKTAMFWMSYMDHISLVLSLINAVKSNDYLLYAHCIDAMTPLFFSYGGQNYARYLTYFSVFLANVELSHPGATALLERGAISVARSFIPGNRADVDKTMEETFMKHAKSHGGSGCGVTGLTTNHSAYQRWVLTSHLRSQYVNETYNMADMLTSDSQGARHRDLRPAEVIRSEKCVTKTCEAIECFLNPFSVETKDKLIILSSGASATTEIEKQVLEAETLGQKSKAEFISNRLETGRDFFLPVKRLNLKTLADMNKVTKVTAAGQKNLQYKQQGNVAFQLFVKSQNEGLQLDMRELMTYPLTPVPYSIGTADGFFAKTDKSKGFHHLTKEMDDAWLPPSKDTLTVYDGNAIFYCLKELPTNFGQISSKIFDAMTKDEHIVFSTDQYHPKSVKAMERKRRGVGEKLIVKGPLTKKPVDWKSFLNNDENKEQLIEMLLKVWSTDEFASKLFGREVILICKGEAYALTSPDGIKTETRNVTCLTSSQEETDTRVILYCEYARRMSMKHVVVKSPDSDVFYILMHYAQTISNLTIYFETGYGNKKRLLDISEISSGYTHDHCSAFLSLHSFTGCDTTSAFKGIGKIKPLKLLLTMPVYVPVFAAVGSTLTTPQQLIDDLEAFVCRTYGGQVIKNVDELRHRKINQLCDGASVAARTRNVDMSTLPPCKRSLEQHIRRVNYQVWLWKQSHNAMIATPDPCAGHGWTMVNGNLEPLWFEGEALPQSLWDIATGMTEDNSDDEGSSDDEEINEEVTIYNSDSD